VPNLNSYLNFTVSLDNSVAGSPILRLTDTTPYTDMGGVDLSDSCIGYWEITQPDGISIIGNFSSPDVYPNDSRILRRGLSTGDTRAVSTGDIRRVGVTAATRVTTANKELRLNVDSVLQNGTYTFKLNVRTPNYDDSLITKTFTLDYQQPTLDIDNDINLFIPYIKSVDNANYLQDGFATPTIARSFSAIIDNVLGVKRVVTGTSQTFDYAYSSKYYDANYTTTFSYISTYVGSGGNSWVTIKENGGTNFTFDVYKLTSLNTLNCFLLSEQYVRFISGCKDNCNDEDCPTGVDINEFIITADSIYKKYCVPNLTHTNNIITPYDLGGTTNVGGVYTLPIPTVQWTAPTDLILEIVQVISPTPITFGVGTEEGLDDIIPFFAVNGSQTSSYVYTMSAGDIIYFTGGVSTTQIILYTR